MSAKAKLSLAKLSLAKVVIGTLVTIRTTSKRTAATTTTTTSFFRFHPLFLIVLSSVVSPRKIHFDHLFKRKLLSVSSLANALSIFFFYLLEVARVANIENWDIEMQITTIKHLVIAITVTTISHLLYNEQNLFDCLVPNGYFTTQTFMVMSIAAVDCRNYSCITDLN